MNTPSLVGITILSLACFFLTAYAVPHRHYVIYDEYNHMNMARNIAERNMYGYCGYYDGSNCEGVQLTHKPAGYHTLLALWMKLAGKSEKNAFIFSAALGALSVVAMGLLGFRLFNSSGAGFWASALLAALPLQLKYSAATSLELPSFLFLVLALYATAEAVRSKSRRLIPLVVSLTLFLVNIRMENLCFLFLIPFFFYSFSKATGDGPKLSVKDTAWLLPTLLFVLPVLLLVVFGTSMTHYQDWTESLLQRWKILTFNLPSNLMFWLMPFFHAFALTPLALYGIWLFENKKHRWMSRYWSLFFLLFLFGYSAYRFSLFHPPQGDRFALIMYPPVLLFAGYSLAVMSGAARGPARRAMTIKTSALAAFLIASYLINFLFLVKRTDPIENDIRATIPEIARTSSDLPVLACNPSPYLSALNRSIAYTPGTVQLQLFIHKGIYIAYNPQKREDNSCADGENLLRNYYDFRLIKSFIGQKDTVRIFLIKKKNSNNDSNMLPGKASVREQRSIENNRK
ncbi:MAG: glycosyltransferase family 39 protein [bacterium]